MSQGKLRSRGAVSYAVLEERLESLGWALPDAVARSWWARICETILPEMYAAGAKPALPCFALPGTDDRERELAARAARREVLSRRGDVADRPDVARRYPKTPGTPQGRHQKMPGGKRRPIRPEVLHINGGGPPPRTESEVRAE